MSLMSCPAYIAAVTALILDVAALPRSRDYDL